MSILKELVGEVDLEKEKRIERAKKDFAFFCEYYLSEAFTVPFAEYQDICDSIKKTDILYVTRIQRERFSDPMEYEKVKNSYVLKNNMLENTKPNMRVLHPLPRVNEIDTNVDTNSKAYYFPQALNGVYVRQAIISLILGLK
jgi:aspartate carbamoyltransferase catalytic subunit